MEYLCRPLGGKHVAVIEDSRRNAVDTSKPFDTWDEANALRVAAMQASASSFADVKPKKAAAAKPKRKAPAKRK